MHSRADGLDELSKTTDNASYHYSYGLYLSNNVCSNEPLEVKWVNWRWPRYEYNTQYPEVKASIQWMIHNGIILQQLVLENVGDAPVPFNYAPETVMLIRDLDYLDPRYSFNEDDWEASTYKHIPGPNGYGHVSLHEIESPAPVEMAVNQPSNHNNSTSTPADQNHPGNPVLGKKKNTLKREVDRPRFGTAVRKQSGNAHVGDGDNRVQNGTPLTKELRSVAAVTGLFHNGEAVKIPDKPDPVICHTLQGHDLVEVVVAYKIIALPASEAHWENFMVTADEADVSKFLHEECADLWESTEGTPLCSLGISMMDLNEELGKTTGRADVDIRESEGLHRMKPKTANDMTLSEDEKAKGFMSVNEGDDDTRTSVDKEESDLTHNTGARSASQREQTSFPSEILTGSSPKIHIEYMVWRHLEHILSVCAVPLSTRSLKTGNNQRPNTDNTALVALTCGDMSGHRVSTSASL